MWVNRSSGRACDRKMSDSRENKVCEDQYGGWTRASLPREEKKGKWGECTKEPIRTERESDSGSGS